EAMMRSGLLLALVMVAGCATAATPPATPPSPAAAADGTAAPNPAGSAAAAPAPAPGSAAAAGQNAFDDRPAIAVFPFANGGSYGQDAENFEALEVGVQQMLLTELAQNSELRIVERSLIRDILAE